MILFDLWYEGILTELERAIHNKIGFPVELAVKVFNEACEIPINMVANVEQSDHAAGAVIFDKNNVVCSNDEECGFYIYNSLKENIICCNNQIFIKRGHIWTSDSDALYSYLTDFVKNI